jgi:predicted CoA-binding protein
MQQGIRHDETARQPADADLAVVPDRRLVTDHRRLFGR